ncbi:MAG TPA: AAA family ATPase, partial [Gemmatimonadaceae bacterium]|nr:AAA family ATPase [Gemmatimonadaceae bacterium]
MPATSPEAAVPPLHPSGDPILAAISGAGGAVGALVKAYPGRAGAEEDPEWLERWVRQVAESVYAGDPDAAAVATAGELDAVLAPLLARAPAGGDARGAQAARVLAIEPHYFRGFRAPPAPVSLDAALVVVHGHNSAGKTSLAEAFEWLLTGELSRRAMRERGSARELAQCVGNQFRPRGERTWVEAEVATGDGERVTLRRVLDEDYGTTGTSACASRLFRDGRALDDAEGAALVGRLFGGSAPILMQHTLQRFVHSEPAGRRQYFERLLRLDELTHLIEKAVMGPAKLAEMPSPGGGEALRRWEALAAALRTAGAKSRVRRVERERPEDVGDAIRDALPTIAAEELGDESHRGAPARGSSLHDAREAVAAAQDAARQRGFPPLAALRPRRTADASLAATLAPEALEAKWGALREAAAAYALARRSAADVTEAELAVARALAQLTAAGLLPAAPDETVPCPLCDHHPPTLTPGRVAAVRAWEPVRAAVQQATDRLAAARDELVSQLRTLHRARGELIPAQPADADWEAALRIAEAPVVAAARELRAAAEREGAALAPLERAVVAVGKALVAGPPSGELLAEQAAGLEAVLAGLPRLLSGARRYAAAFAALDAAVGAGAGRDADYAVRELWLAAASDPDAVAADLAWESAKSAARDALQGAREALVGARQELVESRRAELSAGMTRVWRAMRADTATAFSRLSIPAPRGRGFPIEIEVKAALSGDETGGVDPDEPRGVARAEVDALRVFSESQVNALGVAAFVTRARMLGQRVLVFDDPAQSMDEPRIEAFARGLLGELLDGGMQVIIL